MQWAGRLALQAGFPFPNLKLNFRRCPIQAFFWLEWGFPQRLI